MQEASVYTVHVQIYLYQFSHYMCCTAQSGASNGSIMHGDITKPQYYSLPDFCNLVEPKEAFHPYNVFQAPESTCEPE